MCYLFSSGELPDKAVDCRLSDLVRIILVLWESPARQKLNRAVPVRYCSDLRGSLSVVRARERA